MTDIPAGRRLIGLINLSAGTRPSQVMIFVSVLMCSVWVTSFTNLMQPLLVRELLHVPSANQGVVMGALTTAQQLAFLVFIGLAGSLADRLGRRTMLIIGMAGFAACMWLYPFIGVLSGLFAARIMWGAFDSSLSVGRVGRFLDYPDGSSRGKFVSFVMVTLTAAGSLFTALVASRVVSWFQSGGLTKVESIRYGFVALSLLAVAGAAVAFFLLDKDRPAPREAAKPGLVGQAKEMVADFRKVFAFARTNPRLAVVLMIGSVVRTDFVILGSFLGLWVLQAAAAKGVDAVQAVKTTGLLMSVAGITGIVTPPFMGWLADRVDRVAMLVGVIVVTGVAFCMFGIVGDVLSPWMFIAMGLVGLAEAGQAVSSMAALGDEAPPELRGSVIGVFTALGVASVLAVSVVAGVMFDKLGPASPFILEGVMCFTIAVVAIVLIRRRPASSPPS